MKGIAVICSLVLLASFITFATPLCGSYKACSDCTSDPNCGWFVKGDNSATACVNGNEYQCKDPLICHESEGYYYFYERCPTNITIPIQRRRSTRKYTETAISKEQAIALVTAAQWAPSAMDTEPLVSYVVSNQPILHQISEYAKKAANVTLDSIFYQAPTVVFFFTNENALPLFEQVDAGLAMQNFMLAAHDAGLATCPIGFAKFGEPIIRQLLQVPQNQHFHIAITLGHPAEKPTHGRRKPVINFVF